MTKRVGILGLFLAAAASMFHPAVASANERDDYYRGYARQEYRGHDRHEDFERREWRERQWRDHDWRAQEWRDRQWRERERFDQREYRGSGYGYGYQGYR